MWCLYAYVQRQCYFFQVTHTYIAHIFINVKSQEHLEGISSKLALAITWYWTHELFGEAHIHDVAIVVCHSFREFAVAFLNVYSFFKCTNVLVTGGRQKVKINKTTSESCLVHKSLNSHEKRLIKTVGGVVIWMNFGLMDADLHKNLCWITTAIRTIIINMKFVCRHFYLYFILSFCQRRGKNTQVLPGKHREELVGVCETESVAKLQEDWEQFSGLTGENASAVVYCKVQACPTSTFGPNIIIKTAASSVTPLSWGCSHLKIQLWQIGATAVTHIQIQCVWMLPRGAKA